MRRNLCTALLGLFLLSLSGCAAIDRPPTTLAQLERDAGAERQNYETTIDTIVDRLAQRTVTRGDQNLDILLLSGGGQHGAYGIGFLRGWEERKDQPMPHFDLVTGVSTGALQAPFALLGTPQALSLASTLYRSAASDFAPTFDWLFWLRRTGGVVNTTRYQSMIETVLDADMQAQLRTNFNDGRQLVISTTDDDLGTGHIWDIGHEMRRKEHGVERVQQLMLATSAIPGIFPPIVLDGHVHSDGGVVSNTLAVLDFDGYRKLAARLTALGVLKEGKPVTVRLWVVMNVWTHGPVKIMDPASSSKIRQRGNSLMFSTQQPQFLSSLDNLARAVTADVPGLKVEMHYTAIPAELANEPGASDLFNGDWMTRLEKFGYERAQSATPWDQLTTPYARPAPVLTSEQQAKFGAN